MYAFHKQIQPPTGVEHCAYCHFFSPAERSLVVAQASELTVFRLLSDVDVGAGPSPQGDAWNFHCGQIIVTTQMLSPFILIGDFSQ